MAKSFDIQSANNAQIVQANELIESMAKMDLLPLKLFELAVGAVDVSKGVEHNREVAIDKDLVISFLPREEQQLVSMQYLGEVLRKLQKASTFVVNTQDEFGYRKKIVISPISSSEFTEASDTIMIRFSPEVMPYITELKRNFTQYSLEDIGKLRSSQEIALYKFLMRPYNEYKVRKARNQLTEEHAAELLNPIYRIEQLRYIFDAVDKYPRFGDFDRRLLSKSVNSINKNTEFEISYDKIKAGRRISKIQFHINRMQVLSQPKKSKQETFTYEQLVASEYTSLLLGAMILKPLDVTNQNLIVSLGPLYQAYASFEKIYSRAKLKKHLEFVAGHMGEAPQNLGAYLETSFKNYQQILKNQEAKPKKKSQRKLIQKETLPDWAQEGYDPEEGIRKQAAAMGLTKEEYFAMLREKEKELKARLNKLTKKNRN
ncbi:replication initiation protein [Ligilactobacillus equi]